MCHYEEGYGALCLNLSNVYVQAYRIEVFADAGSGPVYCLRSGVQSDSSGDISMTALMCAGEHVNRVGRVRAGEDGCLALAGCVHEASPGVYGLRLDGC